MTERRVECESFEDEVLDMLREKPAGSVVSRFDIRETVLVPGCPVKCEEELEEAIDSVERRYRIIFPEMYLSEDIAPPDGHGATIVLSKYDELEMEREARFAE